MTTITEVASNAWSASHPNGWQVDDWVNHCDPVNVTDETGWTEVTTQWASYMRASGCSPATIEQRLYQVRRVGGSLAGVPPSEVTTPMLVEWLSTRGWSPNTLRAFRGALRAFYSWMVAAGHVERSPAAGLPAVKVPRGAPRPVSEEAYEAALRGVVAADPLVWLAMRLAGSSGLRRGEVARSRREHLERDLVGWSLRVIGKGGHERLVPVPDDVAAAILASPPGWLFPSPRPERSKTGHMTPAHLAKMVRAELPATDTMHALRHRFGTVVGEETGDLRVVQELLGHADPRTAAGYTKVSAQRMHRAASVAA